MTNLIRKLDSIDPQWRERIDPDPLCAAVELGLLEPDELDGDDYAPLDFND